MDRHEKEEQLRAMDELTDLFDRDHRFTAADICRMHKMWLGNIYEWAGQYRQVKMSKGDFPFVFPEQIPKLMAEFEKGPLHEFTPCHFKSHDEIAKALAVVHTELVLIHPFREGNGRTLRLFLDLLTVHAGYEVVAFNKIPNEEFMEACRKGMLQDYEPMKTIYMRLLRKTTK